MTDEFKEFEHQGWESAADQYDSSFSRLTQQTVPRMLEVLGVSAQNPGMRFLDVACGPGYMTAEAAQRGAQAVGVDFSAAMIDKCCPLAQRDGRLTFQVGDAENLAGFQDNSFDAAGMNFGILHLSNPQKAVRETHRVLVRGGRAAFTVWRRPEEAVGFALVLRAIEEHGNPNLPLPQGPAFFQYSDPAECERLLATCGFSHQVETLLLTWKLSSPDELFTAFCQGTARTGGLLRRQKPDDLARIREAVRESALEYAQRGDVIIPMPAQLAWGEKQ
jgi:ubiquinone/menaquinone biosynthesis C-methylase UbiE